MTINGRFEANYDSVWRFFRQTMIPYANNIGKYYPESLTREEVMGPRSFILELISGGSAVMTGSARKVASPSTADAAA